METVLINSKTNLGWNCAAQYGPLKPVLPTKPRITGVIEEIRWKLKQDRVFQTIVKNKQPYVYALFVRMGKQWRRVSPDEKNMTAIYSFLYQLKKEIEVSVE